MKVHEAMKSDPVTLSIDSTICDAAITMKSNRIGSILIMNNGNLEGIVTERDIITRAIAAGLNPKETKLSSIMSKPVICIKEDEELVGASELMKKHDIRRLAVINKNDKLTGIITSNDIAGSLRRSAEELAISYYLMSRKEGKE